MEMEDDNLADSASDFGELFEGETAVFESSLAEAEALGIENGLGIIVPVSSCSSTSTHQNQGHGQQYHNSNSQVNIRGTKISSSQLVEEGLRVGDLQFVPDEYMVHNHHNVTMQNDYNCNPNDTEFGNPGDSDSVADADTVIQPKKKVVVVKDVEHFIRLNINKYFKKKGYREIMFPKTIPKETVAELIDPGLSRLNTIAYGPNFKAEEIPEELEKFWKFYQKLKVRNEPMSCEIRPMLIPMLVYFVRQSLTSARMNIAHKLIADFSKRFLQENKTKENGQILMSLAKANNSKAFEEDKFLMKMYHKDTLFVLSDWTFMQLKHFVSKLPRLVMIHLFTNHFVVELLSSQEIKESWSDFNGESNSDSESESYVGTNKVQKVLDSLRSSVKANLPSVSVYTTNGRPTCGAVSKEATTIAYGMQTSGIRICSISSAKQLLSKKQSEDETQYIPSIKTVNGHEGSVNGVGFHPRTKLLFSVGQDSFMRAWDLNNDSTIGCKAVYRGHLGPIWSLDITASGQLLATGSMDSSARVWVPERVDCVRILAGHYFDVDCVRFHPNEAYVATGSVDKSIRFWSVSNGNMVRMMTGSEGRISCVAFHSSGKYLAGGGEDDRIRVWDIAEGQLLAELPCVNACRDLSFCGSMLAATFRRGDVQVWNLRKIVGGDDFSDKSGLLNNYGTIPVPYTINCQVSSLFKLYYKDPCNLYCLGSDPVIDSNECWSVDSSSSVPPTPNDDSPMYVRFNNVDSTATSGNDDTPLSGTTNNNTPEENNYVDEADGENTNNTITSSDIEFEVDDRMLQSLADETPLPS